MAKRRTGVLAAGLGAAGAVALLAVRPRVQLKRDVVDVPVPPDDLLAVFRRRLESRPDDILAAGDDRVVMRFAGEEGPFSFRTVELVTFEPAAITFEHLAGPFSECHERFDFVRSATGTRVTHSGSYRLRGGLWTAPLAVGPVKRAFESHVRRHLDALADDLRSEP